MASSSTLHLLLASSLLFFSFTNQIISADDENIDLQVIRDTCKPTTLPDFCFTILSADPNSKGKNFHDLTAIAIGLANAKGAGYRDYVDDLLKKATEPGLKQILEICSDDCNGGVVFGIAWALDDFRRSDYDSAATGLPATRQRPDCNRN